MPKFQFERSSAKGKQALMTKTNSEDRFAANQTATVLWRKQRSGSPGAVGKRKRPRVEERSTFGCGCGRDNGDAESALPKRS